MISDSVKMTNLSGLQMNMAGKLCEVANRFESRIIFYTNENAKSNAKSFLSILGAGVKCGDEMVFLCDGVDEASALEALISLVKGNFEE